MAGNRFSGGRLDDREKIFATGRLEQYSDPACLQTALFSTTATTLSGVSANPQPDAFTITTEEYT